MSVTTFFLKDVRTPGFRESLSIQDATILDNYLEEMDSGPGDGALDIVWMETGKGYYLHEHILAEFKEQSARDQFLLDLHQDIEVWLAEDPKNHTLQVVRDRLFPKESDIDS